MLSFAWKRAPALEPTTDEVRQGNALVDRSQGVLGSVDQIAHFGSFLEVRGHAMDRD